MERITLSPRTAGTLAEEVPRLVREVEGILRTRFATVASKLAAETLREDRAYAALLTHHELSERIHLNLCRALADVTQAVQGLPLDLGDAMATGSRRVEQGLPLTSLLRTYRQGGRLLWQTLSEVVTERFPAELPTLLPAAAVVWDVMEQTTDAVAESYRLAEAARAARDQDRRHALLDALLDGSGAGLASEAAAQLGLPEYGRYAVIELLPTPGAPSHSPPPAGPRILWRIRADSETGLVHLADHRIEELRDQLVAYGTRAGISPVVDSVADLGRARWLAELALRTCRPHERGPVLLDDRLPEALIAAQGDLGARLRTTVFGRVLALPPDECEILLATLEAWLGTGGSAASAGERLYCHRNTVSNRLRRLEHLTGRTLNDPSHLVELSLALAALRQYGP
ncbi:PucR family transcriptional regulator [Streptomyces sp. NBC_01465]|uniref:PucR family transcriptional regulator n=1 Tax=Streptomyces sp. NBC_01465 TaxID=2903878 RepID=UPI002E32AA82|nr:helix-turn-helix domain-containing protein [Streptomyces sp. NBC_01465]